MNISEKNLILRIEIFILHNGKHFQRFVKYLIKCIVFKQVIIFCYDIIYNIIYAKPIWNI